VTRALVIQQIAYNSLLFFFHSVVPRDLGLELSAVFTGRFLRLLGGCAVAAAAAVDDDDDDVLECVAAGGSICVMTALHAAAAEAR